MLDKLKFFSLILLVLVLPGCGQKGDLYLMDKFLYFVKPK